MSTPTDRQRPPLADRRLTVSDAGEVQARFRHAAGRFPTGVTVVSTVAGGEPHGMTVNAFTTVSLHPLLVLISVTHHSRTFTYLRASGVFSVTVLGANQRDVAHWFANPNRPAGAAGFTDIPWRPAPQTGSPVLLDGVSYFDCTVDRTHVTGDHTLVVGRVQEFDVLSDCAPLLFMHSRLVAAHPSPALKPR